MSTHFECKGARQSARISGQLRVCRIGQQSQNGEGDPERLWAETERNQMHRQIGNAVAWPVSEALGRELMDALFREREREMKLEDAMDVED